MSLNYVHHVLVVEDNPADARLIQEAFKECHYECELTISADTKSAWTFLESQDFDLVLTDMGDPADGIAFIRSIRNDVRLKGLPIIVLSGGTSHIEQAYEAGANAFMAKRMDIEAFFDAIRVLTNFWCKVAMLPKRSRLRHSAVG